MNAVLPRFYPILDTEALLRVGLAPFDAAKALLAAGAQIIQLRHKKNFDRKMFETAQSISDACRKAKAIFVVNDRADVAVLLDAALHVGQDDLPAAESRALIGSDRVLGLSTHNEHQLLASLADSVDYIAIGPMFQTGSKQNPDPVVGMAEFSRLRPMTARPVVAIGGINLSNAHHVLEAGADSVAVIGGLFPLKPSLGALQERAEMWIRITNE